MSVCIGMYLLALSGLDAENSESEGNESSCKLHCVNEKEGILYAVNE
jgi:hypothetical protein